MADVQDRNERPDAKARVRGEDRRAHLVVLLVYGEELRQTSQTIEEGMLFTFLEYDHSFSSKCHLGVIPRRRTSECRPPTLAQ
jgi:hypothetical protein